MKRITIAALGLVVGGTAGCRDMGLEGNLPLAEAEQRQTSELVATVMQPTDASAPRLVVDGRLWVAAGLPARMAEADLRAVGSADGRTVYARAWDAAPYDALFVRSADTTAGAALTTGGTPADAGMAEWIQLLPVSGRTGAVPGAATGEGAPAPDPAGH